MGRDNLNLSFLVEQLQQGNEAAFTALYDLFSKPLYRNMLRLVKDEAIAEELLQDLFMKIWESRETISVEGSFKSFLYKVAQNLVYGHFRKIAKNNRLVERMISNAVGFDPTAEDVMIRKESHILLRSAIESLSPQRKQVYTLCKLEGKSYEEAGHELGVSPSTIRDHIVKGNKAVKRYLDLNRDIAVLFITIQLLDHLK
ncbi:RNA polymerase sigma factor [Mucilaginibacter sp. E4BP6]|uniref:RNA polymerase sigma factor n=1 Tax=Mucilaginibacter sp. E4BP6 TaxID=2723089 RepID=UPI0015C97377|nr:sigma-70 family RNA polymerase sigma factor [Mucilaginibacter sp. E4BP6]NYE66974.1 RNA polymerase sigma-70 factor (ECF subfamily) [Mucilaginibacter sp. E4BP6]